MLNKSVAMYDTAVTLSPNAAHLWNERGNAFAADGQNDQALASYEKSLSLDQIVRPDLSAPGRLPGPHRARPTS